MKKTLPTSTSRKFGASCSRMERKAIRPFIIWLQMELSREEPEPAISVRQRGEVSNSESAPGARLVGMDDRAGYAWRETCTVLYFGRKKDVEGEVHRLNMGGEIRTALPEFIR